MFNFSNSTHKIFKQFGGLFGNRWAMSCFAAMTIQQIIEASSTFWLVTMMTKITNGESFLIYLYMYLTCLLLPYFPGCLANIFKINWKQEAQRSLINAFVQSNHSQIGEWSNKGIREEKLSILTTEGPNTLHLFIDYIFDLYTWSLSVIFNILALSIVVEPMFGMAYFSSVLIVIFIMQIKRRSQRRFTHKALKARIDLYQALLTAWDNVVLGNLYNFTRWKNNTSERLDKCLTRNVDLERFDQILAIVVALITALPSLAVVIYYAHLHRNNMDKLVPFLVTLPLLFMILSYTYQTMTLIFRWAMHRSKLTAIYKAIQPIKYSQISLEKKVKWQKIQLAEAQTTTVAAIDHISLPGPLTLTSYVELIQRIPNTGRLTLRGENGAGKSTLLMLIKNALADRAFFLPTQNHLSFEAETNKYSTGESLKNRLVEILENVDVDVLLLDEWDANLDTENQEILSELIDELATKKCVIEVRHR